MGVAGSALGGGGLTRAEPRDGAARARVREALRDEVLSGELVPGKHLVEAIEITECRMVLEGLRAASR